MNATDLINSPIPGTLMGTCYLCGQPTTQGHERTMAVHHGMLYEGDLVCASCFPLISERQYRARSWCATSESCTFGKLSEIGASILAPPEPPFFIYLTKSNKKMGWLGMLNRVSTSKRSFFVTTDFILNPVFVVLDQAQVMARLLLDLRDEKVTKAELRSGYYRKSTYERAIKGKWLKELIKARGHVHNPVWEVLTYVVA